MSEPLKRTFNGCLTCRKRKVRCKGGDPCQNCVRMQVNCHASFDNNFRVSTGQPPWKAWHRSDDSAINLPSKGCAASSKRRRGTDRQEHEPSSPPVATSPHKGTHHESIRPTANGYQRDGPTGSIQQQRNLELQSSSFLVPESLPQFTPMMSSGLTETQKEPLLFGGDTSDVAQSYHLFATEPWDFDFSLDPFPGESMDFLGLPLETSNGSPAEPDPAQFSRGPIRGGDQDTQDTTGTVPSSLGNEMAHLRDPPASPPTSEWAPRRKRRKRAPGSSPSKRDGRCKTSSDAKEAYFAHYEKCINTYTLKDDGRWGYHRGIYDFIHSPQCDPDSPFRLAVIAWTAKHHAVTTRSGDTAWRTYYSRAKAKLEDIASQCKSVTDPAAPAPAPAPAPTAGRHSMVSSVADVVICSTLFLCRCDVLNDDVASALSHINHLRQRLDLYLDNFTLSAFASKVLLWTCYLHVHICMFSTPPPGSTNLLYAFINHPEYRQILSRSHTYLSEIFGNMYPADEIMQDTEKIPISIRTHEIFCLVSNILQYRSWTQLTPPGQLSESQMELAQAKVTAIDLDIRRLDAEFGLAKVTNSSAAVLHLDNPNATATTSSTSPPSWPISTMPPRHGTLMATRDLRSTTPAAHTRAPVSTDRTSLHWLSCYAVFLMAKILWSRVLRPDIRSDDTAAEAVGIILQIAFQLRQAHRAAFSATPNGSSGQDGKSSRSSLNKVLRSMLWPLPLFMASIETTDKIHADWITTFMDEVMLSERNLVPMSTSQNGPDGGGTDDGTAGAGGGMSGGIAGRRVLMLMARLRERQDMLGRRVDVESVMREMMREMNRDSGIFIM